MSQSARANQRTATEILKTLEAYRQELYSLGVRKLGLFGSYKRGTANPESDLDFLVVFEQSTFDSYMNTKFFLEDLFQCRVDLVLEHNLKPRLRPYILDEVEYVPGL